MVRKAPATTKNKGSHKDETRIPGVTSGSDMIQQMGDAAGIALDNAIASAASEKRAEDVMDLPLGGLNNEIADRINSE